MNRKKMLNDFLKAGLPIIISGIIAGCQNICSNFNTYIEDENSNDIKDDK